MKAIFLDIDGVLNDEEFYTLCNDDNSLYHEFLTKPYPLSEFDPRCVERLKKIVNETGARIILSSSWRTDDNETLRNIFNQVGIPNFAAKTPVLFEIDPSTHQAKYFKRGEEIQKFLDQFKCYEKYVILDDESDMLDCQKEHFIKCNAYYGLTDQNAEEAIKILGKTEDDLKKYWDNMKPFDINKKGGYVDIPVVKDKKLYEDIIVKNLIRCGAIPKSKLEVGKTYLGYCRNSSEAIWNGEEFEYKRYKWGCHIDDSVKHFEDDMVYDVFIPLKEK